MTRKQAGRGTGAIALILLLAAPLTAAGDDKKGVLATPVKLGESGITLNFGGFAKVDFIQDFDPIGNEDQFKVNSIPMAGTEEAGTGGSTNISARQTRFTLEALGDESAGNVRIYLEGDFFGTGNAFRMRQGYGEWNGLLGGQTWSTYQDISARPFTLDYEGPDAEVFIRQPMLRYTHSLGANTEWSIAVEDQESQLTLPTTADGTGRSAMPDIPARVRYAPHWGHVQLAGIVRQLRYVSADGSMTESATGYGLNLSTRVKLFGSDALMGQLQAGNGTGRYIESFSGQSSDAVLTAAGELETLNNLAFVLGYEHAWSSRVHSTIAGALATVDTVDDQPDDAIMSAASASANLVFSPNKLVSLGGEFLWGERENRDGATGTATRFQFSIQYKFR